MFHTQSEKYSISTDEFEGNVRIRDGYGGEQSDPYLNVSFGFRGCISGEWAVAAYVPDLAKASPGEAQLWSGFEILGEDGFVSDDRRFQKWWSRYILGRWEVDDGPIAKLDALVRQFNAIAQGVVNAALFSVSDVRALSFPSAQNTHRYQHAHAEVYKLIIDELNKEAIKMLGEKLGILVKTDNENTLKALKLLFPDASVWQTVRGPFDRVANQRRLASHKERPQAEAFAAFEEFGKDIRDLILGMEAIRDDLAKRLNVNVARCEERASAMRSLPTFDMKRPTQSSYSIFKALQMEGKTVQRVRTGEVISEPGCPETEALVIEFSDGSLMSIDAACNLSQIIHRDKIEPEDLHITLWVTYVPPMLPHKPT
jgi:hypothetical protein